MANRGQPGRHGGRTRTFALLLVLLCLATGFPAARQVGASADAVRLTKVNIPAAGEAGDWALAPGSDVRCLVVATDGVLYAAVKGLDYTLYRSADGGRAWSRVGNVRDDIVAIAVSPLNTGVIYYATPAAVFMSGNGGRTFDELRANPGEAGTGGREITSLAVTDEAGDIIAIAIRDTAGGEFGGIYTLDVSAVIPTWEDTGLGAFDACAVAFSPQYSTDHRLEAVVTDETDSYVFTRTGNDPWNAGVGAARLDRDNSGVPSPVAAGLSAAIAFPDTYDEDLSSPDSAFYIGVATGDGGGDVYRIDGNIAPEALTATDVNAGAAYGESNTDIAGLSAGAGYLLAVTADARSCVSNDGGVTWTWGRKGPTGDSGAAAAVSGDGRMYAATGGTASAVSLSEDAGVTWNQAGLTDTYVDTVLDLAPSPAYDRDNTLFLLTFGGGHSLWRSRDGGASWERILCADPSRGDVLGQVALPPGYGDACLSVFIAGESGGAPAVWESTDNGQTFRRRFTHDQTTGAPFSIDAWAATGEKDLVIGSYDGNQGLVYRTTNGGNVYSEATPAGSQPISSIAVRPAAEGDETILAGSTGGLVYLSEDGGFSFVPLPGGTAPNPFVGPVTVAFDPGFESNRTVYAACDAAGSGIYRFVIGESDAWEDIDSSAPPNARFSRVAVSDKGTLYAASSIAGGGLERCLDPRSSNGATFETATRGLDAGATLLGLWSAGDRIWSIDTTGAGLLTFNDTLTSAVELVSPDDGSGGMGSLIDHSVRDVRLDWSTLEGATDYEWQCNYENDFSDVPAGLTGGVSASSVRLPALEPATTYYWRVRASSPFLGPWSEKRSFTTSLDTEVIALRPESPAPGAAGVPVQPFFQWTALAGADAYELLVAGDVDFSEPCLLRTLPASAWQCDVPLDHAATYYWKVRAVTATTRSPWSAAGVFTTEPQPEPEAAAPPVHEVKLPPPTTTSATGTVAALRVQTAPPTLPPQVSSSLPPIDGYYSLPVWIVYLIGALVITVILSLIVVLAMVQKIRR